MHIKYKDLGTSQADRCNVIISSGATKILPIKIIYIALLSSKLDSSLKCNFEGWNKR